MVPVIGYKTRNYLHFGREIRYLWIKSYQTASEIAEFLSLKWKFPLSGGVLVTNPFQVLTKFQKNKSENGS